MSRILNPPAGRIRAAIRAVSIGFLAGGVAGGLAACATKSPVVSPGSPVAPSAPESAPSPPAPVLSDELAAWMESARHHNPEWVRFRAVAEIAAAQAATAEGWEDPELRLGMGRGDRIGDRTWWSALPAAESTGPARTSSRSPAATVEQVDQIDVALRFSPPNPLTMSARNAVNRALAEAARADLRAVEDRIQGELKAALFERDAAERARVLTGRLIEARRSLLDATVRLEQAGELTAIDRVAAERRVWEAEQQADRHRLRRQAAMNDLLALAGYAEPAAGSFRPPDWPEPPQAEGIVAADWENRAQTARGELAAAQWRERAALATLREARSTRLPWFTFWELSYGRAVSRDDADGLLRMNAAEPEAESPRWVGVNHEAEEEWRIQAGVNLPVFAIGPRATRVAQAGLQAAGGESRRMAAQVAGEVRAALREYADRSRQMESFRRGIQDSMERVRAQEARAGAHPADLTLLEEARLRETSAELAILSAEGEADLRRAWLRLEAAVGAVPIGQRFGREE